MNAKFRPGRVVGTPGAFDTLTASGQDAGFFLDKHLSGDWGEVDDEDQKANDQALADGGRLLSSYRTLKGVVVWVLAGAALSGVPAAILPVLAYNLIQHLFAGALSRRLGTEEGGE